MRLFIVADVPKDFEHKSIEPKTPCCAAISPILLDLQLSVTAERNEVQRAHPIMCSPPFLPPRKCFLLRWSLLSSAQFRSRQSLVVGAPSEMKNLSYFEARIAA